MLFLDSLPLPPPTWEGVHVAKTFDIRLTAEEIGAATVLIRTERRLTKLAWCRTTVYKVFAGAHTILRLPPPAPSHMGGGCALPKLGEPPDGGGNLRDVKTCDKVFATLMLFLDSHPLPPPTWEGVHVAIALIAA